jgi:hypothetical protein
MSFIEVTIIPEAAAQNPAGVKETKLMVHDSAILALLPKDGKNYEVILKPEYLSTIQAQVFGLGARIKNIMAVIKNETLR